MSPALAAEEFRRDGLQAIGPEREPVMVNHFLEEDLLGDGFGLKFSVEVGEEAG